MFACFVEFKKASGWINEIYLEFCKLFFSLNMFRNGWFPILFRVKLLYYLLYVKDLIQEIRHLINNMNKQISVLLHVVQQRKKLIKKDVEYSEFMVQ